jgi:hypothetical protein
MADLHIPRHSLFRSRRKLKEFGVLNFSSAKGASNVTYNLIDLELLYRDRNKTVSTADVSGDVSGDVPGVVPGVVALNKNNKPKPKQVVALTHAEAFQFFAETGNCRLLKEKFILDDAAIAGYFKIFYDSKIDLGDLNNKTTAETARNFYYWLPKYLAADQKEKSCAIPIAIGKESFRHAATVQPIRGVAAAMKFAGVKMRGEA